jgi:hypothetical protein
MAQRTSELDGIFIMTSKKGKRKCNLELHRKLRLAYMKRWDHVEDLGLNGSRLDSSGSGKACLAVEYRGGFRGLNPPPEIPKFLKKSNRIAT